MWPRSFERGKAAVEAAILDEGDGFNEAAFFRTRKGPIRQILC